MDPDPHNNRYGSATLPTRLTCMAGPRNWQPRALTAAQRLADSCCGFWCCSISSVTLRSPSDLKQVPTFIVGEKIQEQKM